MDVRLDHDGHAYREVAVKAGNAIVRIDYWPPGLTRGLVSSVSVGRCLMVATGDGILRVDLQPARSCASRRGASRDR
jgi:hypothetical protein